STINDTLLTVGTYLIEGVIATKNPAYLLRYLWGVVTPQDREGKKRALQTLLRPLQQVISSDAKEHQPTPPDMQQVMHKRYPVSIGTEQPAPRMKRWLPKIVVVSWVLLSCCIWWYSTAIPPG
ncbi:MAG: hypothetical protein AAF126_21370, partial [Chloroflexota bacterium]